MKIRTRFMLVTGGVMVVTSVLDLFFGCWHRRKSFPRTSLAPNDIPEAAQLTGMYIVCLDWGKEFAYDWKTMKTLSDGQANRRAAAKQPKLYVEENYDFNRAIGRGRRSDNRRNHLE